MAKGETLYSIAWRYNMDHRRLARANGIGSDYRIYPGQRLNLDLSKATPARTTSTAARTPPEPASRASSSQPKTQTARAKKSTSKPRPSSPALPTAAPQRWQWPVDGKILASFKSNGGLNKGIDIAGDLGEPVIAAAAGEVVYSGTGLRGYGRLLIVKHSENYLSAYAHNSKLLVREGDKVRAGETIAHVGSSGTDRTKLHFEIRYDGKPVDPTKYLPRR